MPPALTPRGSAYLAALTLEIDKKLQRALASASQRRKLLQELFADIALEVDDRAKVDLSFDASSLLFIETGIIFGEEYGISMAEDRYGCPICFYNVLADYFVCEPQNGKSILDLIVQLWSQSFASNIFALLFHKWIFEVQPDNPEVLLRYSSALVQGATNVFCMKADDQGKCALTKKFSQELLNKQGLKQARDKKDLEILSITSIFCLRLLHLSFVSPTKELSYQYLLEGVALDSERLKKIPQQAQRDLFLLLSRFIFFYDSADKLERFLNQFPEFPNAFLIGGASDIFVIELADQIQKLKVEPVLLHYLSQIKVLQGLELRMTTSTRLKTCLYSFTSPGGPMYPTRAVRHAAWDALDFLFPVFLRIGLEEGRIGECWEISSPYYKSLLPATLSVVLAVILLELSTFLYTSCPIFSHGIHFFYLGKADKTKAIID
ncbi:hypothetical protein DH2020_021392 [Rehmannia glutinosa]|uniref:Uncharacterized protein n=1 Tax=Rehmannia glutinosa TaxID=99300 RepID=A0ABR0WAC1_REHGL